jgi:mRNA interferase MazF
MRAGDIVLVRFPFSDLESSKKRPALLLSTSELTPKVGLLTIAMITSKIEGLKIAGDFRIKSWKNAGLLHESVVRLSKIATIEKELALKRLGRLQPEDLDGIKSAFKKHFKFWLN